MPRDSVIKIRFLRKHLMLSKNPEVYSELFQASVMKLFAKTVNGFQHLTIFAKIFDLRYDIDRVLTGL